MPIKVTNYDKMTNITGIENKKTNDETKRLCRSISAI